MCNKKPNGFCLSSSYRDYEQAIQPQLAIVSDKKQPPSKKRSASEMLGESAAIQVNADRHGLTFQESKDHHHAFHGAGVFDLIFEADDGEVEIKEAKGGTGRFGDRRDHLHGGRCTQCTSTYNEVIIDKYRNSNYKGRHPSSACSAHSGNPSGTCKDCKQSEADFRQNLGEELYFQYHNDNLTKVAVRGDYDGDCPKRPRIEKDYTTVGGKEVSNV